MKKQFYHLLVVITTTSSLFIGCSITGWSSKDIPDGSNVDIGNTVTVTQKDGTVLTGEYIGIQEIPMSDYVGYYNSTISHTTLDQLLPQFGDNIQFTTRVAENKIWEGQFLGFDSKNISVRLKGKSEPDEFYISSLNALSNTHGKTLETMQFRKLYVDGSIPLRSAIVLKSVTGDVKIPLNEVEKIISQSDFTHNLWSN